MTHVYLFDVDGTLTPKGSPITSEVATEFLKFTENFPSFLSTSKAYKDLRQILPGKILSNCKGVYSSSGSEYYENGVNVYRKAHQFSKFLKSVCENFVEESNFRYKTSGHFQRRPGALTISVVGMKSSRPERIRYMVWDRCVNERTRFIKELNESDLGYDAFLSGNLNIEVLPSDQNKSAIVDDLIERHGTSRITFFGDRISQFGHDLPLAERLREVSIYNRVISVPNAQYTKHHIERMLTAGG
ncbi:MAG: HAD-IIB family hydrolase [Lentilitoribacter sp.]